MRTQGPLVRDSWRDEHRLKKFNMNKYCWLFLPALCYIYPGMHRTTNWSGYLFMAKCTCINSM